MGGRRASGFWDVVLGGRVRVEGCGLAVFEIISRGC